MLSRESTEILLSQSETGSADNSTDDADALNIDTDA